ncbi:hypothetical protein R3W88_016198 [Solanum pinnatisectum]|uniref:RNase H type-1 domain-containing protein n=1 Tax=Solanum pinnatisectum TaxID=50273 RepID=A0AAV9KZU3_9SOLN|nr:hypothetical protein R3W88_016198 [Solanum pinnatisectum]
MLKNRSMMEKNIRWKINSGNCSFWWDDWLGVGALGNLTSGISSQNNTKVHHFLTEGKWNEVKLRQHVPPRVVHQILRVDIQIQEGVKDEAIWKHRDDGNFTCSSALEIYRKKKEKLKINTHSWHKHIPFKISFLMWRAIRFKLPTNDKIINFGMEPAKCSCYIRQGWDDINHIFIEGYFATQIWKFFSGLFGVEYQYTTLKNHLLKWWSLNPRNEVHKLIIQAVPLLVSWNLWKNRCSAKYGGKKSSISRVHFMILKDSNYLLQIAYPYIQWPMNWKDVMKIIEECRHDIIVTPVTWEKRPPNSYKLNTDGSALTNPGRIGGGGIIRDDFGNLVYAFAVPLGTGTNSLTEIQAAIYGIQWGL